MEISRLGTEDNTDTNVSPSVTARQSDSCLRYLCSGVADPDTLCAWNLLAHQLGESNVCLRFKVHQSAAVKGFLSRCHQAGVLIPKECCTGRCVEIKIFFSVHIIQPTSLNMVQIQRSTQTTVKPVCRMNTAYVVLFCLLK